MPAPQASQPACFMPCFGHICCQLGWEVVGFLCAGEQGEGKGWSARPIFSVLEDNFGWTGRNSSCHAGSLLSSKSSTTFAAPLCFLHPDFLSFTSNRMRLWLWCWHFGTCKCCQEPGKLLVQLLLEGWLQLSSPTSPQNIPGTPPQNCLNLLCHLQPSSDILPCYQLSHVSSSPVPLPIWECLSPPAPPPALLASHGIPTALPPGHCEAWSSPSKVFHPTSCHVCTTSSIWAWHIYFPAELIQKAH